jgi:3-oxo-5alpha-steroid 4-dehydrogenase
MQPNKQFLDDVSGTSIRMLPARTVDDLDVQHWDQSCDMLVVSVGSAGTTAALRTAKDS